MPDGSPGPQAADGMADWLDQNRPVPTDSGPLDALGRAGLTAQNLIAAAGAGAIAVSPDTGQAVLKQLDMVQDEARLLIQHVRLAGVDPRLGGGYAEQVSRFLQDAAVGQAGSAEEILTKFNEEIDQLKTAVKQSIDNYHSMDQQGAHDVRQAGEPL